MGISYFTQHTWDIIKQGSIKEVWINNHSFDELLGIIKNRFPEVKWRHLPDWEEMEDREILVYLSDLNSFKSELIIITDISYREQYGPFGVHARDIFNFADGFFNDFGECMFNGDTVIFCESERIIWVFHHEGMYTSFKI